MEQKIDIVQTLTWYIDAGIDTTCGDFCCSNIRFPKPLEGQLLAIAETFDLLGGEDAAVDIEIVELAVPVVAGGFVAADADVAQSFLKWRSIYGCI